MLLEVLVMLNPSFTLWLFSEWSAPWAAVYLCGWAHWFGYGFLIDIAYTSFYLQQVKSDWGHLPDRVNSAVSNR